MGVLLGFLYLFIARPTGIRWWIIFTLSCIFLVQSVLTFSRGGLLNLVFALPMAIFFFSRSGGGTMQRVFVLTLVFSAALYWALPRLNSLTGGALQSRYEDLSTTGRAQLVEADLRIWKENPILGVGAGVTTF
jgi:O-antigen ligase